jgi:hypothetical protein
MQVIAKKLSLFIFVFPPVFLAAQSVNLFQGEKHSLLLRRLEIQMQNCSSCNLTFTHPVDRNTAVRIGLQADSLSKGGKFFLDKIQKEQLRQLFIGNAEWVPGELVDTFLNINANRRKFFQNPASFYEVRQKDFFLSLNPVLQLHQSLESGNKQHLFLNTRGFQFRGLIAGKLGFSGYLTDNQERAPLFVQQRIDSMKAVPGMGWYKSFKRTATDYLDGRGSVYFNAAKYVSLQFGYDKLFLGDGYRSLFLSDHGNSYLFFKTQTRIWKLNYLTLFMELNRAFRDGIQDRLFDKKYAAMHHLGVQVAPWLTLGVFDAVIFGRKNRFDFTYLNPVILLRLAEQQNGSADNSFLGMDFKANIKKRAQVYGQVMIDEFLLKEMRSRKGWWANKYGLQFGMKYLDLFGASHLDLQAELNMVRPFTYAHYDSISSYTHYNQPLAHPLGANFRELVLLLRYQPQVKWTASMRIIHWKQGLDSSAASYGSNIFKLVTSRPPGDYGYFITSGISSTGWNAQVLLSYEWKENLFLELSGLVRKIRAGQGGRPSPDASVITLGVRWNMFRREYDY